MISKYKPAAWVVALCKERAIGQGLAFSYGVQAIEVLDEPRNWREFALDWVRENQVPGPVAMLVAGPSPAEPDANHRIEFLRVGKTQEV
jgi:pyruvate kinase